MGVAHLDGRVPVAHDLDDLPNHGSGAPHRFRWFCCICLDDLPNHGSGAPDAGVEKVTASVRRYVLLLEQR